MRETSRVVASRMPNWLPVPDDVRHDGLSQQHVNLGMSLMGAYVAAVSAVGVRSRGRSSVTVRASCSLRSSRAASSPCTLVALRGLRLLGCGHPGARGPTGPATYLSKTASCSTAKACSNVALALLIR